MNLIIVTETQFVCSAEEFFCFLCIFSSGSESYWWLSRTCWLKKGSGLSPCCRGLAADGPWQDGDSHRGSKAFSHSRPLVCLSLHWLQETSGCRKHLAALNCWRRRNIRKGVKISRMCYMLLWDRNISGTRENRVCSDRILSDLITSGPLFIWMRQTDTKTERSSWRTSAELTVRDSVSQGLFSSSSCNSSLNWDICKGSLVMLRLLVHSVNKLNYHHWFDKSMITLDFIREWKCWQHVDRQLLLTLTQRFHHNHVKLQHFLIHEFSDGSASAAETLTETMWFSWSTADHCEHRGDDRQRDASACGNTLHQRRH